MNPRTRVSLALAACAALALAVPAAAQQIDGVLRGFEITGDYVLTIDGKVAPAAEIYQAERVPAYLIVADELPSPTLVLPAERSVQTVGFMKVIKRKDGTADILADAELVNAGSFRVDGESVAFAVGGHPVVMKPRPYLIGEQRLSDMLSHNPDYRRKASAYKPDSTVVASLKKSAQPVRVRVYFGSWCPFCKRYVPNLLAVAEQLQGSRVEFEFYGLPHGFDDEPAAKRDGVHGVPTGIVYVAGREVGRLTAGEWEKPESALSRLIAAAKSRTASQGK